LIDETNEKSKNLIRAKINEYLTRAEKLQAFLQNESPKRALAAASPATEGTNYSRFSHNA
jgi:hypothetical protein